MQHYKRMAVWKLHSLKIIVKVRITIIYKLKGLIEIESIHFWGKN